MLSAIQLETGTPGRSAALPGRPSVTMSDNVQFTAILWLNSINPKDIAVFKFFRANLRRFP